MRVGTWMKDLRYHSLTFSLFYWIGFSRLLIQRGLESKRTLQIY